MLLPSRLSHQCPISLLDAAVQTTPPCDVSTQMSDQQDTLSCDLAVRTSSHGIHISSLDAAAQTTSPSTVSQHVSTQMGSRSASSFSVDMFVQTLVRSTVLHDVATQLPLTEFFIGCIYSNSPLDRRDFVRQSPPSMQGSHALLQPPPGLEHVKSILPTTENWLRNLYTYSKKNYMSTEDKHETNHINNKYNDTNTDTRKMHNT